MFYINNKPKISKKLHKILSQKQIQVTKKELNLLLIELLVELDFFLRISMQIS